MGKWFSAKLFGGGKTPVVLWEQSGPWEKKWKQGHSRTVTDCSLRDKIG